MTRFQPSASASFPETAPAVFHVDSSEHSEPFGPMDLVCRRVKNDPTGHWSTTGAGKISWGHDVTVRLPNPNHPDPRPPVHRHHGADDVTTVQAWGHSGSGPADLALNVLAAYLPVGADGPGHEVKLWDGSCVSEKAYRFHQPFKAAFLRRMPTAGGVITEAEIRAWISEQEALSLSGVA